LLEIETKPWFNLGGNLFDTVLSLGQRVFGCTKNLFSPTIFVFSHCFFLFVSMEVVRENPIKRAKTKAERKIIDL